MKLLSRRPELSTSEGERTCFSKSLSSKTISANGIGATISQATKALLGFEYLKPGIMNTVFPRIVSPLEQFPPLNSFRTCMYCDQRRKLFKGGNYSQKYGIQILSENQEIGKSLTSRPFWFLFAFQHFTVQQKFPFVVINVTVHAEVRSLLPKGCSISKPHDFWRATFTVTRHFFSFRTAFIITDHSAIWYIFSLHLRRLIGVGQTNDSLSRLVGVSSMYSKKSCFSHFNSFSPFFPFQKQ